MKGFKSQVLKILAVLLVLVQIFTLFPPQVKKTVEKLKTVKFATYTYYLYTNLFYISNLGFNRKTYSLPTDIIHKYSSSNFLIPPINNFPSLSSLQSKIPLKGSQNIHSGWFQFIYY